MWHPKCTDSYKKIKLSRMVDQQTKFGGWGGGYNFQVLSSSQYLYDI